MQLNLSKLLLRYLNISLEFAKKYGVEENTFDRSDYIQALKDSILLGSQRFLKLGDDIVKMHYIQMHYKKGVKYLETELTYAKEYLNLFLDDAEGLVEYDIEKDNILFSYDQISENDIEYLKTLLDDIQNINGCF